MQTCDEDKIQQLYSVQNHC